MDGNEPTIDTRQEKLCKIGRQAEYDSREAKDKY